MPEAAQHRALDGDGGVAVDESKDRVGDLARQLPGAGDLLVIDERPGHGAYSHFPLPRVVFAHRRGDGPTNIVPRLSNVLDWSLHTGE